MPKKIRELKQILRRAGWIEIPGGGKGSHTTWAHANVERSITLSGKDGEDARQYQEKDVARGVQEALEGG